MAERARPSRREALRITAVAGLSAAFGGSLAAALLRDARLHRLRETRTRMGTLVTLTAVHGDPEAARAMIDAGFREMGRLEAILSRHRPDAALGRLNAGGRLTEAPGELLVVLGEALELARGSGGAFDPTVLPVLRLWEDSFAATRARPAEADVRAALALVGHRDVAVDGRTVTFRRPGMAVTLDGIAKGYVVDRTVDVLVDHGAERVLVDAGGDMATDTRGSVRDPWRVAIEDPRHFDRGVALLHLGGRCLATSGDYLGTFGRDRRFHHILDPRTGRSPESCSSVSVLASSAMLADALSTTIMVLGPREGLALLRRRGDAEALVVTKSGERLRTEGWTTRLT